MLEAYSIAIRIRLINGVTAGLTSISSAFAKAHGDATKLQGALDSIKFKLAAGGALIGAGAFGFLMLDKAVKPAEEYAHQLNIMRMAGMSNLDIARATADAWKNTGTVITTTATQNLRAILDLKNILGTMKDAEWALPIVTKVGAVMASSSEANIKNNAQDIAFQMAKALDIIGAARDPGTFSREAGLMSKVVTAFQNRVTPKQFQGVFQYARQAKFDLSDEFKYEFLPSLMLEMSSGAGGSGGGSRGVGPMLAALYRVTNQGYINQKSVPLWEQLGLLKPGTALKTTTTGTVTAALNNRALAAQNPFLYATQVLEPAIRKKYGNVSVSREREIIGELFRGNQLAASAMMEFISKPQNYLRDQQIIRHAMPFNQAYDQAQKNDPAFQYTALRAQLDNAETALGIAVIPLLIKGVRTLANIIQPLGVWLIAHPDLTKGLVIGLTALSAAMVFGGTVLLLSAAFSGLGLLLPVLKWGLGDLGLAMRAMPLGAMKTGIVEAGAAIGGEGIGLVGAFGKLRFSLLGLGLVIAGIYSLSQGVKGKFDKDHPKDLSRWKPDWIKGTSWDKPLEDTIGLSGFWNWAIGDPAKRMHANLREMARIDANGKATGSQFYRAPSSGPSISPWANLLPPDQTANFQTTVIQPGAPAAPGALKLNLQPWGQQPPAPQYSAADLANAVKAALSGLSVKMDGQIVGQIVSNGQGAVAARPATGPSGFDTHLSPLWPDMNF